MVGSHERDYSFGAKFYTDGTDVFQNYLYAIIHCLCAYIDVVRADSHVM